MAEDPFELDAERAAVVRGDLLRAWRAMVGEPQEIDADLRRLAAWFGPAATPAAVRRRVDATAAVSVGDMLLTRFNPPLALTAGGRTVITPEGRLALELLLEAEGDSDPVSLAVARDRRLADLYRSWSLQRVRMVDARRSGQARRAERAPAVGLVVLLLLHGAEDPERALVVERADEKLGVTLREMLAGFAEELTGRPSRFKEPVWGFPVACAQRRFAAVRRTAAHAVEHFWIDPRHREELLDTLADELVVVRRGGTPKRADAAVRTLAATYERLDQAPFGRDVPPGLLDDLTDRFISRA